MYIGELCNMANVQSVNQIDPSLYVNPFVNGPAQGVESFAGQESANTGIAGGVSSYSGSSELSKFRNDMQSFSSIRKTESAEPNSYVENQDLYSAISSIGDRELKPKVDSKYDWTF